MAQQRYSPDDPLDADKDRSGHTGCLVWLTVIGAALLVYGLTGSTLLTAALLYAQAWWKPFRCGWWLLNADPISCRGRAYFWFYLAMACWNAAASAFATIVILIVIVRSTGRQPPKDELGLTMLVLGGGVCLSAVLGIVGVLLALRGKVRIWAHPNVRESCRGDFRRLGQSGRRFRGSNHAVFVVATSLVFPFLATGTAILILNAADAQRHEVSVTTALVEAFFLLVGPLCMIPVYAFLSSRVIAKTPADGWSL